MRMNSETWYLRGTLLFFNGGLRRRTLQTRRVTNFAFKTPKGADSSKLNKVKRIGHLGFSPIRWWWAWPVFSSPTSGTAIVTWGWTCSSSCSLSCWPYTHMLTMMSCWPLSCWPWCHVHLYHVDHDVILTFLMLSMVILAFGLTEAPPCDIWLVLWIFGEGTKVIPHRPNNTSWPKQYLLTLANVRVRTWKQWVTVSEQRTSKSKHLDHHKVLTFREKTSLHSLHNYFGSFSVTLWKERFS